MLVCASVCVCVGVCVCVCPLRIVSVDQILFFINAFIIITVQTLLLLLLVGVRGGCGLGWGGVEGGEIRVSLNWKDRRE